MWYKAALIFVMTAALVTTLPQAKRLFRTIAYAVGLVGFIGLLLNQQLAGRLGIRDTRYQNANEYAWSLLVGLTFIGYMYIRGTRIQKIVAALMGLIVLLAIAKTGSRGGFLGVIILILIVFIRSSMTTRIRLILGITGMLAVLMVVLPGRILARFTTWSGDLNPYELHTLRYATVASTEARWALLKDSLRVTAAHPFLGVGPGNFAVAQDKMAQARGELGTWQVTHNSYTEVSAEMGLPGLAIYLTFLYQVFKQLNSILKTKTRSPAWNELRMMAMTLQATMCAFLLIAISTSLEFNTDVPILAGIAVALGFLAQKQRAIDRANAREAVILPPEEVSLEPAVVGQY